MLLPRPFPDELLFSRIIRYLAISGISSRQFVQLLYGNDRASIHPYLTAGLFRLEDLANEHANNLLLSQTLSPLFTHFLPVHAQELVTAQLSNNTFSAVRASQLSCVREIEHLTMKFCPMCVKEDIQKYGVCYWHRVHQIPGLESCSIHPLWLVHVNLPKRARLNVGLPTLSLNMSFCNRLSFELAQYSEKSLLQQTNSPTTFQLSDYLSLLQGSGYLTNNLRCRRRFLCAEFYKFIKMLSYPSDMVLPKSSFDFKYLSTILSENASQHIFKHLLFGFWLTQAHCHIKYQPSRVKTTANSASTVERKCIILLEKGFSLAEVSRKVSKSRCYVKALALRKKIIIKLKPKILFPQVQHSIIALAYKGFHRKEIARQLGISSGSVEQTISIYPELVQWRKRCKYESKQRKYKVQIIRYLQHYPDTTRKNIKRDCSGGFFWLYLHAKNWLESVLPAPQKPFYRPRSFHNK